jgi:hypothetical protein
VPLARVRLTAAKSSLGRHRKLRLARPQGSDAASAPEDDELRLARPQGSDSASAPKDDGLRLARPQGLDSASAPADDGLRLARPQGSDSASAPADDGLHLAQTRVQTGHVARGVIITLSLASSGYGDKTGVPSGSPQQTINDDTPHAP